MKNAHIDPLYLEAGRALAEQLKALGLQDVEAAKVAGDFSLPPQIQLGHLAFPCFLPAKALGKKPPEVAAELAQRLADSRLFVQAKAVGPYLNLFLSSKALGDYVVAPAARAQAFQVPTMKMGPVMVEYSQPNTHKELHVGHMRNLCLGNALVRLLKYSGRPVVSNTFPGDVGTHVAKCLWYLKYHNTEKAPAGREGEWLGRMYSTAHNKLEDEKGTPQEEISRGQLTAILKQLEQKQGEFYELWKQTRQWSIALMNKVYDWAGVTFDEWYWESDVDSASVTWVRELLQKGLLQTSEGAVGLDLEDQKLGFCMLLKSDGNGLYATKDLELARRKFEKYDPSQSIYVVDMRQELHFKQVFAVLKKIGFSVEADRCHHLKYNFVELPDGAMSSRKGNIVPITDLIVNMREHVKANYLDRYRSEWSEAEIETVADQVAQGAIKYGMNVMDPNKKIVFKMDEWLKLDGESGPYIQYTVARIQSLLAKNKLPDTVQADYSLLVEPIEQELILKLSQWNRLAESAAQNLKTSLVCTYLYETAKLFNNFYHDCPIGKLEDLTHRQTRLELAKASAETLKTGLGVLGIPTPQKM